MNNVTLGSIFTIVRGGSPRPITDYITEAPDGINWIKIGDTSPNEKYVYTTEEKIKPEGAKHSRLVKEGDFILSNSMSFGRPYIMRTKGCIHDGWLALSAKEDNINQDYLYHVLSSPYVFRQFQKSAAGATVKNLNKEIVSKVTIPLPKITEQKEIADILDKIDDLRRKRQEQIDLLDTLVKSRFVEMFGEPKTNPYNYKVHQLSDFIEFMTSGSRGWAKYCVDEGKEWFITIKNVYNCHISLDNMHSINAPKNAEARRTKVQEGDLLISITADLGRTGVVSKELAQHGAYINQHLTCVRVDRKILHPVYTAYYLESSAGKEQFLSKNQNGVKAGLNFNAINSLKILVPPLPQQEKFIAFVEKIDKSKLVLKQSLEELDTLKKALMQKFFG